MIMQWVKAELMVREKLSAIEGFFLVSAYCILYRML